MQPTINFGSEAPQTEASQSQSYWQLYAPQRVQDIGNYISQKATDTYQAVTDTVNKWSTRKKIIVAGSILTALAVIYNRDQIMQWVNDLLQKENTKTESVGSAPEYDSFKEIRLQREIEKKLWNEQYALQKQIEDVLKQQENLLWRSKSDFTIKNGQTIFKNITDPEFDKLQNSVKDLIREYRLKGGKGNFNLYERL